MLHPCLQIGVVFPQTEQAGDAGAAHRIAGAAEDLGFDHLVAYDHVLGVEHADRDPELLGPYDEDDPFHDPFVLFAHLAGRLERLSFMRLGDGFVFAGGTRRVLDGLDRLRELADEAGRARENIGAEALFLARKGTDDLETKIATWAEAGGTHASVVTMGLGLDSTEAHVDYLGTVAEALRVG